LEVAFFK